jgi:hypothetical protein
MRRSRRGSRSGLEFGGSGEDSFVAVVVTKLTGALLFILLLTMVIMALLPKAVDIEQANPNVSSEVASTPLAPLKIETPATLPDAVATHPYTLALAATGGRSPHHWSSVSPLPEWLSLDPDSGRLTGTPPVDTPKPLSIEVEVTDGLTATNQTTKLLVLPSPVTASILTSWKPRWSAVPWRLWLEQGIGFLLLWLIHLVAMSLVSNLERASMERILITPHSNHTHLETTRRFVLYRWVIRAATLSATLTLAVWLAMQS